MGTFLNHSLKDSEGPSSWLEFFALAGSAFAYLEETPPVRGYDNLDKGEHSIEQLMNLISSGCVKGYRHFR